MVIEENVKREEKKGEKIDGLQGQNGQAAAREGSTRGHVFF